jgi:hypothetical protein
VSTRPLYDLLPAIYRIRDQATGGPLSALLAHFEDELQALSDNVDSLADNWFIETCEEWLVPYIGELLGVNGITPDPTGAFSQRAFVANTLAYRRRKGTPVVLEQLALDITGWPAHVAEGFSHVNVSQHLNHVRLASESTTSLRDVAALETIDGALDPFTHLAELRHADDLRGRFNLPTILVWLYRLGSFPVNDRQARAIPGQPGTWQLHPAGVDTALLNRPSPPRDLRSEAPWVPSGAGDLPASLLRRPLYDALQHSTDPGLDAATSAQRQAERVRLFDTESGVIRVRVDGALIDPDGLVIGDLSDPARRAPPGLIAIDPQLGRLAMDNSATDVHTVEVSWPYGFSADIGGGPYDRRAGWNTISAAAGPVDWQRGVWALAQPGDEYLHVELSDAINEWVTADPRPRHAVICLMDSRIYPVALDLEIPHDQTLTIIAARWNATTDPLGGLPVRLVGQLEPENVLPHLLGTVTVTGEAPGAAEQPGTLNLNGLTLDGTVAVKPGTLGALTMSDCCIVPGSGSLTVEAGTKVESDNVALDVTLERCVLGPVAIAATAHSLTVSDSLIDAAGAAGPALAAAEAQLTNVTVLGQSTLRSVHASSCLFDDVVTVQRRQQGCVRYSWVPVGSLVPRAYRCHPSAEELDRHPSFTSRAYGQPGYGQLSAGPEALTRGASDGGEMGAFNGVRAAHRLAALNLHMDDYLRVGIEAGVLFAT